MYHADFMQSGNQDAENLVDEWCTFLERHGGVEDVYFYAFTIFTSDDFNFLGKALPYDVQMDTGLIDESNLEDRVAKELAKQKDRSEAQKRQRLAKKLKAQGADADDVSAITPSMTSGSALLSSTLSARLGEFNAIEERKAKIKEKESERKAALELIQCAIQYGNESQKQLGTQLLTQKLEMLQQKLNDEQNK
jgi:hypothetical protein